MLKLSDYSQLSEASLEKALAAGHLWYTWGQGRLLYGNGR